LKAPDPTELQATEAPRSPGPEIPGQSGDTVRKSVARVDSLDCYEVTADELMQLEQGSPDSVVLNLAFVMFTAALTTFTALCSATFSSAGLHTAFVCGAVVTAVVGVALLVVWWALRRSRTSVIAKIRGRRKA